VRPRTALLASTDRSFRQRLSQALTGLRWHVLEAETGAQAWAEAESAAPEALIVDSWLPDLDLEEFLDEFRTSFPKVDLLTTEGVADQQAPRGPYRHELLHALRVSQSGDLGNSPTPAPAGITPEILAPSRGNSRLLNLPGFGAANFVESPSPVPSCPSGPVLVSDHARACPHHDPTSERLPELVGCAPAMLDVSRRVRLVAPRSTPVLIEGPTGSGKELVAQALHRLSTRSRKPLVAINCAAIPEALLEAELFGHTRGAFTGAVSSRVGRIESADGGTLFLDEIGEMPLALQAKLLRFVESGELQRIGDNETVKVDVRILAATHRPLVKNTQDGSFRSDLYYRLAVFLIRTPALADHLADLPALVEHFLARMGRLEPVKRIDAGAMARLSAHTWPGNVRELEHVLERAAILAGNSTDITVREIDFGLTVN
jgi:DNA-binding NtrC family response regulator